LEEVAAKRTLFNAFTVDRIFKGLDAIRTILEKIVHEKAIDVDVSDLCRDLEACLAAKQEMGTLRKDEP